MSFHLSLVILLFLRNINGGRYNNHHKHTSSHRHSYSSSDECNRWRWWRRGDRDRQGCDTIDPTQRPTPSPVYPPGEQPTMEPQYTCDISDSQVQSPIGDTFTVYTDNRDSICPPGWFCGALEYEINYDIQGNNLYGIKDYDYSESGSEVTRDTYCADPAGCQLYADGTDGDGCKVALWNYQYWQPTTCNETADYNALTIDYDIRTNFYCCDSDMCNFDYTFDCREDNQLSWYISDLYECWNEKKRDWMKIIWCDDDDLFDWVTLERVCCQGHNCCNRQSRRNRRCRWRWRCSEDLRLIIEQFGQCACQAAENRGFDSSLISELIASEWDDFCPNVDVTCDFQSNCTLEVYWWYVDYKIALKTGDDETAATLEDAILEAIAEKTGVETDDTGVQTNVIANEGESDGPVRRLGKISKLVRKPVKINIKPLSKARMRKLLQDDDECNPDMPEEYKIACDHTYTDIQVELELQSIEDSDFVSSVLAEEMDQAIEDATGGTIYDSLIETFTHIDQITVTNGVEHIIDKVTGHGLEVNETNDYQNLDEEWEDGAVNNETKKNNSNDKFISVVSFIIGLFVICCFM